MWSHINIGKTINNLRLILHVINMVLHKILVTSWYEKKKATHILISGRNGLTTCMWHVEELIYSNCNSHTKIICLEQVTSRVIVHTYLGWTFSFQVNYQQKN